MKVLYILLFGLLPVIAYTQTTIAEGTKTKIFFDDFMEPSEKWPVETSKSDIYLNYDDGDYIISRKNADKPYAVQPNFVEIKRNFVLKSSLELAPSNSRDASMGVFVMLQQGLSGGYIFEINARDRIRIKELLPNGYKYITGDDKSEGWEKADYIRRENKMEVKAYAGTYEFYCNDKLVKRTVNKSYQKGFFGIWLGAETLGKMDYYYVYDLKIEGQPDIIKSDLLAENKRLQAEIDSLQAENTRLKIADPNEKPGAEMAIMVLEKRISQLQGENRGLQAQVDKIKNNSEVGAVDLIDKMTIELAELSKEKDSLTVMNRDLIRKFDICQENYFNLKDQYDSLLQAQQGMASNNLPTDDSLQNKEIDPLLELNKTESISDTTFVIEQATETVAKKEEEIAQKSSTQEEKSPEVDNLNTLMDSRKKRVVKKAQLEIR